MRTTRCIVVGIVVLVVAAPALAQHDTSTGHKEGSEKPDTGVVFRFDDHPSLRFGEIARLDGLATFQLDWHQWPSAGSPSSWELQQARVGISGRLLKRVDYELERELTDGTDAWRDAFVSVDIHRSLLQVRAGHFKIPFSLDQLTAVSDLDFAYRSLAGSSLAPGRDVGVAAHGRFLGRVVHYKAGIFRRVGENGKTLAARATVSPWRRTANSPLRNLTIGAGFTDGQLSEGLNSVNGRTVSDERLFPKIYVNGRRRRVGGDAEWREGSFGLRAELIRVVDERLGQGTDDNDLPPALARGGYLSGTWILTGEKKSDDVRPRHPLQRGGIGAIELAARFEFLSFGSTGSGEISNGPRAARLPGLESRVLTAGVNWYLNRFVRLQANVIREQRLDGGVVASPQWTRIIRLQLGL